MASSKARSRNRPSAGKGGRTVPAVSAPPAARNGAKQASRPAASARPVPRLPSPAEPELTPASGPPLWLQMISLGLAVLGLALSAYETYAHYNGSTLLGCSSKGGGAFDCTAVITSPTSMVFGVLPVAVLGLLFYVFAVAIMTPWAWNSPFREIHQLRLASLGLGMAFVLYLIYAELYDIKQICEYCTGVHIVTFLLFGITVFSAAIWGLGDRRLLQRT